MRVLVLGAGGPAGVNTCRALAEDHDVFAWDENPEHLLWCRPYAVTVDDFDLGAYDLLIPQPDRLVMWVADTELARKTFLPDRRTVALCQDKFEAGLAFRRAGLREDRVTLIDAHVSLETKRFPCWLRSRNGAGAKAAVRAQDMHEAVHWCEFWWSREPLMDFIGEAHLPGRDLAWSSIWKYGELVCSFTRERLEYIYPGLTPEGLTGTPTIARIVHSDEVNAMAQAAVHAVGEKPHGFFSVDLKEDENGIPRPTEINAGRVFTTFGLWAMQHEPNLFRHVFEDLEPSLDCLPEGLTLYRHIDCPAVFKAAVPA